MDKFLGTLVGKHFLKSMQIVKHYIVDRQEKNKNTHFGLEAR